jgi:hypothetical protein
MRPLFERREVRASMRIEDQRASTSSGVSGTFEEQRRHPRTREYGSQELVVSFQDETGQPQTMRTVLWDFSEGGLGMDSNNPLQEADDVVVSGELHSTEYSVAFRARARVAYCREIGRELYRIGVAFREVSYRRIATAAST